jgi:hypothetical protein
MDITSDEIKKECEALYFVIKSSEERLELLRKVCKHERYFQGNYMMRMGNVVEGSICDYCGHFLGADYEYRQNKLRQAEQNQKLEG